MRTGHSRISKLLTRVPAEVVFTTVRRLKYLARSKNVMTPPPEMIRSAR